ncbi:HNH endonuclease [compost metagenome]
MSEFSGAPGGGDASQNHAREGAKFGMLTLISPAPSRTKHPKWNMRCDCGAEKVIDFGAVRSGRQVSCGCFRLKRVAEAKRAKLEGVRVGMLRVLRFYTTFKQESLWLCICDCGCGYIGTAAHLSRARVKSCGCVRRKFENRPKTATDLSKYASNHARRARERGAKGRFTRHDIERIYTLQRGRCASCRRSLKAGYHRDHRVPISAGGSNDASNIELLCPPCNIRKHDKDPIVWANMNGRLL